MNDRWPGLHLFGLLRLSFVVSLFQKSILFPLIPEDDEPSGDKPDAENSKIHIFLEKYFMITLEKEIENMRL